MPSEHTCKTPLNELEPEPHLIVIDGLDESATADKNEIVNLIADYFPDLPRYISVLVTSRPEISLEKLNGIPEINIRNDDVKNDSDLEIYLKYYLPGVAQRNEDSNSGVLKQLVAICAGSFLYAFHVQCELQKRNDLNKMALPEIINYVPQSLNSVYQKYFQRLEDELKDVPLENIDVMKLLELFVAAKGPLPLAFVSRALGLAPDCRETKAIIQKVNVAVSCLLYVFDDLVTVFHKSVVDWLFAKGYKDHEFAVKISDGDKSLWQIYEKVFEKIKEIVCSGQDLDISNDVQYALYYGFDHLLACNMKKCFYWLVDVVIIHVLFSISPEELSIIKSFLILWKDILRTDASIGNELRALITRNIVEIEFIVKSTWGSYTDLVGKPRVNSPFCYLESVLAYSPKGYFSDEEKNIAKSLLSKTSMFVDRTDDDVVAIPRAILCLTSTKTIKAVGISNDKAMAAVAQRNGTVSVVCLPSLVERWQYSTEYHVPCCTFTLDDSFVLIGKLETALSIAERKEVPFFHRNKERFNSCARKDAGNKQRFKDSKIVGRQ